MRKLKNEKCTPRNNPFREKPPNDIIYKSIPPLIFDKYYIWNYSKNFYQIVKFSHFDNRNFPVFDIFENGELDEILGDDAYNLIGPFVSENDAIERAIGILPKKILRKIDENVYLRKYSKIIDELNRSLDDVYRKKS